MRDRRVICGLDRIPAASDLLGIFGVETGLGSPFMLLAMPIALQELVFAVWLIARGFEQRDAELGQPEPARIVVPA